MPATLTRVSIIHSTGSTDFATPPLGWVGNELGLEGDLVTMVAGVVTPACPDGATVAPGVRIAYENNPILATAPAGTLVGIVKFDEDTLLELPIATSTGGSVGTPVAITNPVTTLPTFINQQFDISCSAGGSAVNDGIYYANAALIGTANVKLELVQLGTLFPTSQGFTTGLFRVLAGSRIN